MRKLTEEQKRQRAEYRARLRARIRKLAFWDMVLSGATGTALLIWLAVYFREGRLQGAAASVWFWVGMAAGAVLLAFLVKKFVTSARVVRKI